MPTIQIRDVPAEVHTTYRKRAAAAGMSLQEYILQELVAGARTLSPAEVAHGVLGERQIRGDEGYATVSSAALVRADRDAG